MGLEVSHKTVPLKDQSKSFQNKNQEENIGRKENTGHSKLHIFTCENLCKQLFSCDTFTQYNFSGFGLLKHSLPD